MSREGHDDQFTDRYKPAARALDRAVRGAAVRPLRACAISGRPSRPRSAKRERRSTPIAADPAPPSFANTIEALERSGRSLDKVASVFFNLTGAHTNDELQAIEREIAPILARHRSETYLNEALFARIDALKAQARTSSASRPNRCACSIAIISISPAPARPLRPKPRRGWRRSPSGWRRLPRVRPERAGGRKDWLLLLDKSDLDGPAGFFHRQRRAHRSRPRPSRQVRGHPVAIEHRAVPAILGPPRLARERLSRLGGAGRKGRSDRQSRHRRRNGAASEPSARASLATRLTPTTASPTRWRKRRARRSICSSSVWAPGVASARKDEEALQAIAAGEGGNFKLAPWDWRYLSEKRRKAEFDFDEGELKPYLQLDRMIEAAFYAASRLFGLKFAERFDLKLYHPDVRAWEVTGRDGAPKALFPRRLFRQALKAKRGVDERFPRPAEARRAAIADRGQCDEFRRRGSRRGEPAKPRRCAHALS